MKNSEMFRIFLLVISVVLFTAGCEKESGLPVDGDGNVYDTVVIGTQVWLKENLKTTRYNNGVKIPLVTDNAQWASMTSAAYCWYNNNPVYKENYGALYNWYVVNTGLLCPVGWHVPTKEEWETLINYLGGGDIVYFKLRDSKFWPPSIYYNSNETGFSARPSGERDRYGMFVGIGQCTSWWTSSRVSRVSFSHTCISITGMPAENGYSVRCIKNN